MSLGVRQGPRAPVGRVWRRRVQGGLHDGSDFSGRQALGTGSMRGILGQTRRSRVIEPFPPQQHGGTRGLQAMGNRVIGESLGRQQADPRPQHNPLGTGLCPPPRFQRLFLFSRHRQRVGWFPHTPTRPEPTSIGKILLRHYTRSCLIPLQLDAILARVHIEIV